MKNFKFKNIKYQYKKYFLIISFLSLILTLIFSAYYFEKKDGAQLIKFKMTNKNIKTIYLLTNLETDLVILDMIVGTEENRFNNFDKSKTVLTQKEGYQFLLESFKKSIKSNGLRIYKEESKLNDTVFLIGSNEKKEDFKKKLNLSIDQAYYTFKQFVIKKTENYRNFYLDHIINTIEKISITGTNNADLLQQTKLLLDITDIKINRFKNYLELNNFNSFIEITDSNEDIMNNFDFIDVNTEQKNIYLFSIIIFLMLNIFFIFITVIFKNK